MAALLAGQSISSVASAYAIPKGTISDWKKTLANRGRIEPTQKTETVSLDSLLLGYVQENLVTLREQSKLFRDPEWIKRQEASQVAVLHGVVADKTVRLLEAFGGSSES